MSLQSFIRLFIIEFFCQKRAVKSAVVRQGSSDGGSPERVKVFLRIRPLTEAETSKGEEQVWC